MESLERIERSRQKCVTQRKPREKQRNICGIFLVSRFSYKLCALRGTPSVTVMTRSGFLYGHRIASRMWSGRYFLLFNDIECSLVHDVV